MKVRITKPIRVFALSGEVEVDQNEADRLFLLGGAEPIKQRELPEKKEKRTTRKK